MGAPQAVDGPGLGDNLFARGVFWIWEVMQRFQ